MILLHAHLLGSKNGDLAGNRAQSFWPVNPSSADYHYIVLASPMLPQDDTDRFVHHLGQYLSGENAGRKEIDLVKAVLSGIQELPNKEVAFSPDRSWACACVREDGVSFVKGGQSSLYHVAKGKTWKTISQPAEAAGPAAAWCDRAFVSVKNLKSGDYLLLTTDAIPDAMRGAVSSLLTETSKLSPYQRAEKLTGLLQDHSPAVSGYLISILGARLKGNAVGRRPLGVRPPLPPETRRLSLEGLLSPRLVAAVGWVLLASAGFGAYRWLTQRPAAPLAAVSAAAPVARPVARLTEESPEAPARPQSETPRRLEVAQTPPEPAMRTELTVVPESAPVVAVAKPRPDASARSLRMQGKEQYDRRNFAQAFALYQQAAEMGDKYAQYYLGLMYMRGQGSSPDSTKAVEWIRLAAGQNLPSAQMMLSQVMAQ